MASVTFDHVSKRFGEVIALNDLSIRVEDGEFLVLVGPSGCGKSTALMCLAGLEDISSGRILIGDRDVTKVMPKDRDVTMVFRSFALEADLSIFDNIAFRLKYRKMPQGEIDRRVKEVAPILGIEHLLSRKPRQLSGGQRFRVALARAIVAEPAVFLFDGPLASLDPKLRTATRAQLSMLRQRLRTTFVYVTDDQLEALTMASRIVVMKDGIVQQFDTPRNLYERPANMFVAGYIGSPAMNFFEAKLEQVDGQLRADCSSFSVPLTHPADSRRTRIGQRMILGIRPEDIHDPHYLPQDVSVSTVEAQVTLVEFVGAELYVYFRNGDRDFMARVDSRAQYRIGDRAKMALDVRKIHVFDRDTELAVR
jgi:multiple sugar transport system ATP-binding protein